jgi:hypothetical protein
VPGDRASGCGWLHRRAAARVVVGAGALRFAKNCETNPITAQESGRIRGVGGANEPGGLLEQGCAIGCEAPLPPRPSPAQIATVPWTTRTKG